MIATLKTPRCSDDRHTYGLGVAMMRLGVAMIATYLVFSSDLFFSPARRNLTRFASRIRRPAKKNTLRT
jgi:hypothetical protein